MSKATIGEMVDDPRAINDVYVKEAQIKFYLEQANLQAMRETYNSRPSKAIDTNFANDFRMNLAAQIGKYDLTTDGKGWDFAELRTVYDTISDKNNIIGAKCDGAGCSYQVNLRIKSYWDKTIFYYPAFFDEKVTLAEAGIDQVADQAKLK